MLLCNLSEKILGVFYSSHLGWNLPPLLWDLIYLFDYFAINFFDPFIILKKNNCMDKNLNLDISL